MIPGDRRDCSEACEPVLPCLNRFIALVGENEIDGRRDRIRIGVEAQQLVRCAVRTGRVGAHAKTHRNGLKVLLLLMNTVPGAPPPCLMDKGTVGWIHEANDSVIDVAGQVGREMGYFELFTKSRDLRHRNGRVNRFCKTRPGWRRVGNEDPDEAVPLLARITAGVNAIDFQVLIGGQGWDNSALPGVGVEYPSVIAALNLSAIEAAVGERHAPMGAGIAQGEGVSMRIPPKDEGRFEQHGFLQAVASQFTARQRAVPEAVQHERIRSLALGWFKFRHLSCSLL